MLRVGSVVIRVDDLDRMVAFWSKALGYVPRDRNDPDFVLLRPPDADFVILADPEGNRFCVIDSG